MPGWQTKSSTIVYQNEWMKVYEDAVISPGNTPGLYSYVESTCPGVYIVPLDNSGNTYLVQQYRYALGGILTWECIAGRTDNEDLELAGRRELLEEAGLTAETFTPLGTLHPVPGMAKLQATIYLATGITRITNTLDSAEGITRTKKLPLVEAVQMIQNGDIHCSDSIASLYIAQDYILNRQPMTPQILA